MPGVRAAPPRRAASVWRKERGGRSHVVGLPGTPTSRRRALPSPAAPLPAGLGGELLNLGTALSPHPPSLPAAGPEVSPLPGTTYRLVPTRGRPGGEHLTWGRPSAPVGGPYPEWTPDKV